MEQIEDIPALIYPGLVHMCVCVCVFMCMYVYVCVVYIHVGMCMCMCVCVCVYMHVCMCTSVIFQAQLGSKSRSDEKGMVHGWMSVQLTVYMGHCSEKGPNATL